MEENSNNQNQTPVQPPATQGMTPNPLEQFSQPPQQTATPQQNTDETTNPQPSQTAAPQIPQQPVVTTEGGGKNTKILLFGVGILAFLVLIGALYVFALKNAAPKTQTANTILQQTTTVTPTPTPSPVPAQTDEEALQNIDSGDPSSDLQTIDSDVSQL